MDTLDWLTHLPAESQGILENLTKRTDPTYLAFKKIFNIRDIKGKEYRYPSYEWFQKNPQKSLEEFNKGNPS